MKGSVGSGYTMTKLPFQETESHKAKKYSHALWESSVVPEMGCLGTVGGGYQNTVQRMPYGEQCLENCVRERLQEKQAGDHLLPEVHLASWIFLEPGFVPSVTNTSIQFIKHICFSWMSEHGSRTQSGGRIC